MQEKTERTPYQVIKTGGMGEIEEKKSRFIANLKPVSSEEEAIAFIESMKKKYWDARHNCYAYVLGASAELMRYSDDGEPSGTAGKPMLDVLIAGQFRDIAVVVTRYFGGTLLGTGGLVRAYTQALQAGLENCEIRTMRYGILFRIRTDYNGIGKLQYLLGQKGLTMENADYGQEVTFEVKVLLEDEVSFVKAVTEVTAGKAGIEKLDNLYYIG